ncbi:GNAT family N-acetyltransferase [Streptomyces sp. UH6]|uniref:GNAT family N-acetyltransferase n=1 Tax=Streptomyces sp. UH6 TaxID=2748379 RepID=UPI0015D4F0D6|nr:N-acetyltransferase [Streptomyces sp. UH6]NYV74472.1 N-acetyltransferase [Streptomyces sp. UH6]
MIIRRETPADAAAVRTLTLATSHHPHSEKTEELKLRDALRTGDAWIPALSLLAEDDAGELLGHTLACRGSIGSTQVPELTLLGVLPTHRRRGVGSALVHATLAAADALDVPLVVVLGPPDFYRRFGFRPSTDLGIAGPEPGWGDFFQVRALNAYRPEVRGDFVYPAAHSS